MAKTVEHITRAVSVQRIVVSVSSIDRALEFYRGALGLALKDRAGELAWLETGDGVEVMLHERQASPSDTAVAIGFSTVALENAVERCVGAGGVIVDPIQTRPWGERMAVIRDVDGHIVCVSER